MRWLHLTGVHAPCRVNHTGCVLGEKIYFYAGVDGQREIHQSVFTLCLRTGELEDIPTTTRTDDLPAGFPHQRYGHSMAVYKHYLVVLGGRDGPKEWNGLAVLDTQTREWFRPVELGLIVPHLDGHSAVVLRDGQMHIFGGYESARRMVGSSHFVCDLRELPECVTFRRLASPQPPMATRAGVSLPVGRDYHGVARVSPTQFVVVGGRGFRPFLGEFAHADVWAYSAEAEAFHRVTLRPDQPSLENLPNELHCRSLAAVALGPLHVLLFGGVNREQHYNRVIELLFDDTSLETARVRVPTVAGNSPLGRRRHTASLVLDNAFVLVYGGSRHFDEDILGPRPNPAPFVNLDFPDMALLDVRPTLASLAATAAASARLPTDPVLMHLQPYAFLNGSRAAPMPCEADQEAELAKVQAARPPDDNDNV